VNDDFDESDQFDMWADPKERQFLASALASDTWHRHASQVFDGDRYVELVWPTVRTSIDGVTWADQVVNGLDNTDTRGLASSNGHYATVVWDDDSSILLATSENFSDWTLVELTNDGSAYPIDLALSEDRVGVLLGTEEEGTAAIVFEGPIGSPLSRVELPGDGAPASIVGAGGVFAAGINEAGDVVPQTTVWTSRGAGVWEPASPLPDNLIGQLSSAGDSLVVTGVTGAEVAVFNAVSNDFGQSWQRVETDPQVAHVYSGPAGLASLVDDSLLFSSNGKEWVELHDKGLQKDSGPTGFSVSNIVAVGAAEVIMSRFEDGEMSYFALEVPASTV